MIIKDFIGKYKNHPILFIGTGVSIRYLNKSYTWDGLLAHVSRELKGGDEYYLDVKSSFHNNGNFDYYKIASKIESDFTNDLVADRNGKFKDINDKFYQLTKINDVTTRFKLYVASCLSSVEVKDEKLHEVVELKKARKNIGSVITTNYDKFIESVFEFTPLIGNDILLSNPYGSIYKIHGCISNPSKIIITDEDYEKFNCRHELIKAQLLSLFIHNPIIFLGYSITDDNIKSILKTVFTYVEPNSEVAVKIRENFLLVEYEPDSINEKISEHDIDIEGYSTIRINKIKTDNFSSIYKAISELDLPVSAMDVRKVQKVFRDICAGGSIQVKITEDIDSIDNSDKILAIGSTRTIQYEYQTIAETIKNYFSIIDEENIQLISLIDKFVVPKNSFFPIFGFGIINTKLEKYQELKRQQISKIKEALRKISASSKTYSDSIGGILENPRISKTGKSNAIFWNLMQKNIYLNDVEKYLRFATDKSSTDYRKIICGYDFLRYSDMNLPD